LTGDTTTTNTIIIIIIIIIINVVSFDVYTRPRTNNRQIC